MNNYKINIVFESELDAEKMIVSFRSCSQTSNHLEALLPMLFICKHALQSRDFVIEKLDRYRNEIEIIGYGSKRPEYGLDEIFEMVELPYNCAILLELRWDEGDYDRTYLVNQKNSSKEKYYSFKRKHKIEDIHVKVSRYLESCEFSKAEALISQCDTSKLIFKDKEYWQLLLIQEKKHINLIRKLIEDGLFEDTVNRSWLEETIYVSPAEVLQLFITHGFKNTFATTSKTPIHLILSDLRFPLEKLKVLINAFPNDISKCTEEGSPLWLLEGNVVFKEHLESIGAIRISPPGFYEKLNTKERITESAVHNDLEHFTEFYDPNYRSLALFHALRGQAFNVVNYLNEEEEINWLQPVNISDIKDVKEYLEEIHYNLSMPFYYEMVLAKLGYDWFYDISPQLVALIRNKKSKNIKELRSANIEYKEKLDDLNKLLSRYKRWADKTLYLTEEILAKQKKARERRIKLRVEKKDADALLLSKLDFGRHRRIETCIIRLTTEDGKQRKIKELFECARSLIDLESFTTLFESLAGGKASWCWLMIDGKKKYFHHIENLITGLIFVAEDLNYVFIGFDLQKLDLFRSGFNYDPVEDAEILIKILSNLDGVKETCIKCRPGKHTSMEIVATNIDGHISSGREPLSDDLNWT